MRMRRKKGKPLIHSGIYIYLFLKLKYRHIFFNLIYYFERISQLPGSSRPIQRILVCPFPKFTSLLTFCLICSLSLSPHTPHTHHSTLAWGVGASELFSRLLTEGIDPCIVELISPGGGEWIGSDGDSSSPICSPCVYFKIF